MDEESAEIGRQVVVLVVVGIASFAALGYVWVRKEMPFLRAPAPQMVVPSGRGTLECVVVGGASECTSPVTRVSCVAWQFNRVRDESAEFARARATADWPAWIRVRLASGEEVMVELPDTLLGVHGKHRREGAIDHEWFEQKGRKGGDCRYGDGYHGEEALILVGDRIFIVGTFARASDEGDPMRRDAGEHGGSAVRLVIPRGHASGRLVGALHGGEYRELGWGGAKAWIWFFSAWQPWLILYLCYVFLFHFVVCAPKADEQEREKPSRVRGPR